MRYPSFFSIEAQATNRAQSAYTEEDVIILASIHQLSADGYSLEAIERKLAEGYRFQGVFDDLKPSTQAANPPSSSKQLETLLQQAQERIAELTAELTTTKYQLGVAEGELKAVKEYLLPNKPPNH